MRARPVWFVNQTPNKAAEKFFQWKPNIVSIKIWVVGNPIQNIVVIVETFEW